MGSKCITVIVIASIAMLTGCAGDSDDVYTLYRNGVSIAPNDLSRLRLHIASFDADDGADYNWENCETARQLFQTQPGVTVRYWCENGSCR